MGKLRDAWDWVVEFAERQGFWGRLGLAAVLTIGLFALVLVPAIFWSNKAYAAYMAGWCMVVATIGLYKVLWRT